MQIKKIDSPVSIDGLLPYLKKGLLTISIVYLPLIYEHTPEL